MSHIIPESELHESAQRPTREDADKLRLELEIDRLRAELATCQAENAAWSKGALDAEGRAKTAEASLATVTADAEQLRSGHAECRQELAEQRGAAERQLAETRKALEGEQKERARWFQAADANAKGRLVEERLKFEALAELDEKTAELAKSEARVKELWRRWSGEVGNHNCTVADAQAAIDKLEARVTRYLDTLSEPTLTEATEALRGS